MAASAPRGRGAGLLPDRRLAPGPSDHDHQRRRPGTTSRPARPGPAARPLPADPRGHPLRRAGLRPRDGGAAPLARPGRARPLAGRAARHRQGLPPRGRPRPPRPRLAGWLREPPRGAARDAPGDRPAALRRARRASPLGEAVRVPDQRAADPLRRSPATASPIAWSAIGTRGCPRTPPTPAGIERAILELYRR